MRSKRTMGLFLVLSGVIFAGQSAWGASGQAQLSIDQRGRDCPPNFGFAYYTADTSTTDTCTTLDNSNNDTLIVTDAVASPEKSEPVMIDSKNGGTVTFTGRTGNCYYMVTGVYGGGSGGECGDEVASWTSDFDSSSFDASHFVVYINERYNSEDDNVTVDEVSTVYIELANPANSNPIYFRLSQQTLSGDGLVQILQDDGVTPEPIGADGKTERTYEVHPDVVTQPNGPCVPVMVKGLSGDGAVSIIATEAE